MSTSDGPFDTHILYLNFRAFNSICEEKWKKRLLNLSDSLISLFIIGPLVVAYWKATWCWMDRYPSLYTGSNCFIFGALLHCALCVLREPLNTHYHSIQSQQKLTFNKKFNIFVAKKMYTYIFSMACIMNW
jgi:Fuseless